MRMMLFVPPVMQLIVFGFAVNLDVDNARMAWMDRTGRRRQPRTAGGVRGLADASSDGDAGERAKTMQKLLDNGEVQAAVRVLPGFARDIESAANRAQCRC